MEVRVGTARESEKALPITPVIRRVEEDRAEDGLRWLTLSELHGYEMVDFDIWVVGHPDKT